MKSKAYYLFYKPYGVLSQFTRELDTHRVIGDFYDFPPDVYPVGRLDKDSEGLLLLTNDAELIHKVLPPGHKKSKKYLVQVDGDITESAIAQLRKGVDIKLPNKKIYTTLPCQVEKYHGELPPERDPPIRYRADIPTSWITITLHEGKNRQIRKMCAKIGHPVLRLIRLEIAQFTLGNMQVGEVRKLDKI